MTEQMAYNLTSASLGFVAAICFGLGSSFLSKSRIIRLSTSYWSYNEEHAKAIISQSAQHLTGALFLLFAFVLQIVATQASQDIMILPHPALESAYTFVCLVLASSFPIAFLLFHLLLLREKTILEELKQKK